MKTKMFLFLMCFLIVMGLGYSDVIVFSSYNTRAEITKEGTLHVVKELTLKNTGRAPIIPGELHFRMYEKDDKGEKPSKITGFSAKGHYDDTLAIQKLDYPSQTELVIDIWEPILPGFIYNFKVEYDVEFKPKGILFYDLVMPEEKTTIPIESQVYQLTVPKNKHITYTVGGKVSDNKIVWENINSPQLEYSIIPMPKLPIRAVNVFWFSIIIILCVLLALKIFKKEER